MLSALVVAGSGIAAPLAVTLIYRDEAHAILDGWKTWLGQNDDAVMTALLLIFAAVLIGRGITGH